MKRFGYNNIIIQKNTGIVSDEVVSKVWAIYVFYNTHNNAYYVGQSTDFSNRKKSHFNALKKGNHPNIPLQQDYTLCHTLSHDIDPSFYSRFQSLVPPKCYLQ